MIPPMDPSVEVRLAELQGSVNAGFATVKGDLGLLLQRADQTDRALADHAARLTALERGRWPLPSIAALTAIASIVITLWQTSGP